MKSVLVTGVTGFIGSHLALALLKDESVKLVALARSRKRKSVLARVEEAIRTAAIHAGCEEDSFLTDALAQRLEVIEGDLTAESLFADFNQPLDEIWHSGAKLSFSDSQEQQLNDVNFSGTKKIIELAQKQFNTILNYVSTAYVRGDCSGTVYETLAPDTLPPNNHYEVSKRLSEKAIINGAEEAGFAYRIFRPSIVVAHSETGLGDTVTGIYGFILLAARLKNGLRNKMPDYFDAHPVKIYTQLVSGVNIIPVDRVVNQMLSVATSPGSCNDIYNIVSDNNVTIDQFTHQMRDKMGVRFVSTSDQESLGPVDNIVNRNVEQFAPYLKHNYEFDNMKTRGAVKNMGPNTVDQALVDHLIGRFCETSVFTRSVNFGAGKNWLEKLDRKTLDTELGELNYYIGGSGEQTLFIINAYGQSLYFWNNLASRMLSQYPVVVWEMRGTTCLSGGMTSAFDVAQHVQDAMSIIQAEELSDLNVLAWCTGPKLSLELYNKLPEHIRSITFLTPAFKNFLGLERYTTRYEENMEPVCRRAQTNPEIASSARRALSAILAGKSPAKDNKINANVENVLGLMSESLRSLVVAPFVDDQSLLSYSKQLLEFWDHDISSILARVAVPVLLITGENDEIACPILANKVVKRIPNSRTYQIIGGNHYIHYEKSDAVYSLLTNFIESPQSELPETFEAQKV